MKFSLVQTESLADGILMMPQISEFFLVLGKKKYCGKRRKCWSPEFSPFRTVFLKAFSSGC